MNEPTGIIRGAGGILRRGDRIAVIHRPGHDDWSFPKGKVEAGESLEETALREVAEETGCRAKLGEFVDVIHYRVSGRPKEVHYWQMEVVGKPDFQPSREVDRMEWLTPAEALARLTYERERKLLSRKDCS